MPSMPDRLHDIDLNTLFQAFENHVDPIVITDENIKEGVKVLYVNPAFCKETGYLKEEILGENPKILQGPKSDKETLKRLKRNLLKDQEFVGQSINYRKDGSEYIVQWSVTPLKNKQHKTIAFIALQKIISKISTVNDDKILLKAIVEHAPGMILVTNIEGYIVYANESFCRNTGYSEKELLNEHSRMLKSGKQSKKFYENMWEKLIATGGYEGLFISRKKDGTLFYDKKKITVIKDENGNPKFYLAVSYNVTKDIEIKQNLQHKAYTDSLTNLYNKEKYNKDIKVMMKEFLQKNKTFSLIVFDIDHFKRINDNYGHDVGDFILQRCAKIIKEQIREDDTLYRWGGEEFVMLVKVSLNDALVLAKKLKKIIKEYDFDGIKITASFGVVQAARNFDSDTLFKAADKALYEAKNSGRDKVIAYE